MDDIKVIIIHHLKHKFSLIFDSQVQWLPVLAHEAAKEVQHQQHLFLSELPNEETTEAGNVTMASTEETSGSGENEGSATEGSSEEEEVRLEPDHSTNHELNQTKVFPDTKPSWDLTITHFQHILWQNF